MSSEEGREGGSPARYLPYLPRRCLFVNNAYRFPITVNENERGEMAKEREREKNATENKKRSKCCKKFMFFLCCTVLNRN